MATNQFTVYYTHFGPVTRSVNGKWVAFRIMQEPIKALTQSYMRTKSTNLAEYKKWMAPQANSSNNTLYADKDGNIAFFHVNFMPRRDPKFDWRQPVDGSDPSSDWKGLLSFDESPNVVNPNGGWVYNSNDYPWQAAGPDSPKRENYPPYLDNGTESQRTRHAVMLFSTWKDFTIEKMRQVEFDSYMPGFDKNIPALVKVYDETPASNPLKAKVADQIEQLRKWRSAEHTSEL